MVSSHHEKALLSSELGPSHTRCRFPASHSLISLQTNNRRAHGSARMLQARFKHVPRTIHVFIYREQRDTYLSGTVHVFLDRQQGKLGKLLHRDRFTVHASSGSDMRVTNILAK
jgi:hypothetical protein